MDKYLQLKSEYQQFFDRTDSINVDNAIEQFIVAAILKIWGSNELYSPDYEKFLSTLADEKYTMEQVVTAMSCCADKERRLIVPDFFKTLVDQDAEAGTKEAAEVYTTMNDLLVATAMINGDFTVEEAETLSGVMKDLADYAASQGVSMPELLNDSKTTPLKEDSYLKNDQLTADTRQEAKEPQDDTPITVNITMNVDPETAQNAANIQEELKDMAPEERPVIKKPAEDGEETIESLLEELDGLVGLETVKKDVRSLMNFIQVTRLREQRGMKVPKISYHLVFTGNPGTGKTTVARLVAKLYYHMGILAQGQLVETDRSMLVAGYLGQTAIKTQKVIQEALGGVLFIDEAYSLANDTQDSYGKEAIETILKAMEDHRDELVVIVAGYTDLMHQFIESNPGLSSRFSKYFEFPDYAPEELIAIFERFCNSNGYELANEAKAQLLEKFSALYAARDKHFGNARTARNYFEKAINAQADRIAQKETITDKDLKALTKEDLAEAIGGTA